MGAGEWFPRGYMTEETKEVLVYDAYSDEWSRISDMNLTKKDSMLAASEIGRAHV